RREKPLDPWVRGTIAGMLLGLVAGFGISIWLDPYGPDGKPLQHGTHQQLGMPPCSFYLITGKTCPSCGMTTSFALFVRGDLLNSLRANFAGTLLAVFCVALIPWGIACLVKGRTLFVVSLDRAMTTVLLIFLGVLFLRWFLVLGLSWWT